MAFAFADIAQLVRDRAELDANNTDVTDTVLLRFINRALYKVSLDADWPWLRTSGTASTVAGTATLTLPSGWRRTILLTHDDSAQPLHRVHLKEVRRYLVTDLGRPSMYSVDGSVITLRRTPDAAYSLTHDYIRIEPAITTGAPLIPEAYGQGVIEWAAMAAFRKTQKPDRALEAERDYSVWLKATRDDINQGREALSITPRPGGLF